MKICQESFKFVKIGSVRYTSLRSAMIFCLSPSKSLIGLNCKKRAHDYDSFCKTVSIVKVLGYS